MEMNVLYKQGKSNKRWDVFHRYRTYRQEEYDRINKKISNKGFVLAYLIGRTIKILILLLLYVLIR